MLHTQKTMISIGHKHPTNILIYLRDNMLLQEAFFNIIHRSLKPKLRKIFSMLVISPFHRLVK